MLETLPHYRTYNINVCERFLQMYNRCSERHNGCLKCRWLEKCLYDYDQAVSNGFFKSRNPPLLERDNLL
jgi:hypothetical protein